MFLHKYKNIPKPSQIIFQTFQKYIQQRSKAGRENEVHNGYIRMTTIKTGRQKKGNSVIEKADV